MIGVCIPTYKRAHLLPALISDIRKQTRPPDLLVVVDGEPESNNVLEVLRNTNCSDAWQFIYTPSKHANAAFQRCLGATIVSSCDVIVFVDDDIRISATNAFELLLEPFSWPDRNIVGVGGCVAFPSRASASPAHGKIVTSLIERFGSARKTGAGGLTPVGDRVMPVSTTAPYQVVKWLRGGIMAFRQRQLEQFIFDPDVFAMASIGCGTGVDDTLLGYLMSSLGEVVQASCVVVDHPDIDQRRVIPNDPWSSGFAHAYSRRLINDRYRVGSAPLLRDRISLGKSLLLHSGLNWLKAFVHPTSLPREYAQGYSSGVFAAMTKRPRASTLTPSINWQNDLQLSIKGARIVSPLNEVSITT